MLVVLQLIRNLPKRRRTRRTVHIVVSAIRAQTVSKSRQHRVQILGDNILIEPISQNTTRRPQSADLDPFGPPSLLAVEDREGRPSYLAFGSLSDRAYRASRQSLVDGSFLRFEVDSARIPRIFELALPS